LVPPWYRLLQACLAPDGEHALLVRHPWPTAAWRAQTCL